MLPKHYYAMVEGYNNKLRHEAQLLRLSTWASLATWEGKLSFDGFCTNYFPLWFDGKGQEVQPVELSPEDMEKILQRHQKFHSK